MAEEQEKQDEKKQNEQEQNDQTTKQKQNTEEKQQPKGSLLQWAIPAVTAVVLAAAGFFLGAILGPSPEKIQAQDQTQAKSPRQTQADSLINEQSTAGKGWYYDLEPVATNLSDPGSTRYVRAVLTLEMSPEADKEKCKQFLDQRKPIIANILNIYFAGLTVDDINSDKDMRRIQYELLEIFNETLYGDSKPLVKQVLFREFGLQ